MSNKKPEYKTQLRSFMIYPSHFFFTISKAGVL